MDDAAASPLAFAVAPDGARLAYAVDGAGPTIVKAAHWMSHLAFDARSPVWRPWIEALTRHTRLLRYDARGCGLSERDAGELSLDAWVADLGAVIEASGVPRPLTLLGMSQGGPVAVAYAARYPEQVERLVLYGAYARGPLRRGGGAAVEGEARALLDAIRIGWGRDNPAFRQLFTSLFLPGGTAEQMSWFNDLQRMSATPEAAAAIVEATYEVDVTAEATAVRAPTLVLHARGDARVPESEGRLLAALVPGARYLALEGNNHVLLEHEPAWWRFLEAFYAFLGLPGPPIPTTGAELEPVTEGARAEAGIDGSALTPRERQVLARLAHGWSNKAIARDLGLRPKTARNYVSTVLGKIGARNRSEAAALAVRAGMDALPDG